MMIRYHHMTVLFYSWYSYADYISPARWFVVMNYLVHSLMYTYYALKVILLPTVLCNYQRSFCHDYIFYINFKLRQIRKNIPMEIRTISTGKFLSNNPKTVLKNQFPLQQFKKLFFGKPYFHSKLNPEFL
jgi:hypothetical protein